MTLKIYDPSKCMTHQNVDVLNQTQQHTDIRAKKLKTHK
jgi:hypothetical protein